MVRFRVRVRVKDRVRVVMVFRVRWKEGRKEMFYLTTHSTYFIYSYMASDIW